MTALLSMSLTQTAIGGRSHYRLSSSLALEPGNPKLGKKLSEYGYVYNF
jgi:hypothetical protein